MEAGWPTFRMSSCLATCIIHNELPSPWQDVPYAKSNLLLQASASCIWFLSCLLSPVLLLDPYLHDIQTPCLSPVVSVWALWLISQMLLTAFNLHFPLITILSLLSDKVKSLMIYNVTILSFLEEGGSG